MLDDTIVAIRWWQRALLWLTVPAAAAGLGFLLSLAVDLLARVELPVMRGPIRFLADLPEPAATIGWLAAGAVIGLILMAAGEQESLLVRVSRAEIELRRPGVRRLVPRGDVAVAFKADDRLVLLGPTGRELAREPCHLGAGRLSAAFAEHGVPWSGRDPYADAYRRWVPDLPELPAAAHALFAARQKAVRDGDTRDADDLRGELSRLGYVVRDHDKRQSWRHAD